MVLILQQLANSILVGVDDLFKVTVAVPELFDHPPEGSVTLVRGTVTLPLFPPDIVNPADGGAADNLHDKLTFSR